MESKASRKIQGMLYNIKQKILSGTQGRTKQEQEKLQDYQTKDRVRLQTSIRIQEILFQMFKMEIH